MKKPRQLSPAGLLGKFSSASTENTCPKNIAMLNGNPLNWRRFIFRYFRGGVSNFKGEVGVPEGFP